MNGGRDPTGHRLPPTVQPLLAQGCLPGWQRRTRQVAILARSLRMTTARDGSACGSSKRYDPRSSRRPQRIRSLRKVRSRGVFETRP